ncbi:MAG: hypothetical protein MK105_19670 [Crocinitomicaceae bacterium]|nr:hypothetical protein [Crocinitomicaceae bacterium]
MRFLTLLILSSNIVFGQTIISIDATVKDATANVYLDDVIIRCYSNETLVSVDTTGGMGRVIIDLPIQEEYEVHFTRDGYYGKFAYIDTRHSFPEEIAPVIAFPFQVSLFQENSDFDLGFLEEEPMIKMYISEGGYQEWDRAHLWYMLRKTEFAKGGCNAENYDEFKSSIDGAKQNEVDKDWNLALQNYKKAIELCPSQDFSSEIALIEREIEIASMNESQLIAKADSLAQHGLFYNDSYRYYQAVLERNPENKHAQDRITEINTLVYGQYDKNDPKFADVSDKSWTIYEDNMSEGYKNYELKDYNNALVNFRMASTTIPMMNRAGEMIHICTNKQMVPNEEFGMTFEKNCEYVNGLWDSGDTLKALQYAQLTRSAFNNRNVGFTQELLDFEVKVYTTSERDINPNNGDEIYQYCKLLMVAYMSRLHGDLDKAKSLYKRCLALRPKDLRPQQFIDEIDADLGLESDE